MHNFGQPPAPRTRNNLMESRPRFSPVWRSWRRIWSQRPPQSRYKLQPYFSSIDEPSQQDGVGDFCTVDDDLGKHFFHDFYVAQLQLSTYIRLRLGAPHQSHSKGIARRNMKMRKCTQAGVLAKSGVLTEKDKIARNHILTLKCTNNGDPS